MTEIVTEMVLGFLVLVAEMAIWPLFFVGFFFPLHMAHSAREADEGNTQSTGEGPNVL